MENPIGRAEHEEFKKRMDANYVAQNKRIDDLQKEVEQIIPSKMIEDIENRQDKRLDSLENDVERLNSLAMSIEKLAINMQHMLEEQTRQGKRLEVLESRDGEMWRKIVGYVITSLIGIAIGYIFK